MNDLNVLVLEDEPFQRLVAVTALKKVVASGVVATAPGNDCDVVSRFFAPAIGVDEDPVTGSAHCVLAPYWAERLERVELNCRQISKRGGDVFCGLHGDRVELSGRAVTVLCGEFILP